MARGVWRYCPRVVLFLLGDALAALKRLSSFLKDEKITMAFSVVCGCLTFFPCLCTSGAYNTSVQDPVTFSKDSSYLLSLIIIPAAIAQTFLDAGLDISLELMGLSERRPDTGEKNNNGTSGSGSSSGKMGDPDGDAVTTTRLTSAERLIFAVGVSMEPIVMLICCYGRLNGLISNRYWQVSRLCANNFKLIVTFTPIVAFLQRCTTAFTPLRVALMQSTICISILCHELFWVVNYDDVDDVSTSISYISGALFIATCMLSLWSYLKGRVDLSPPGWLQRPYAVPSSDIESSRMSSEVEQKPSVKDTHEDQIDRKIRLIDEYYQNNVPAAHMVCCLLTIIGAATPVSSNKNTQAHTTIYIVSNIIVFVLTVVIIFVENRVRHNEIERSLLRTIRSVKKSYVRYLSHELRTPLNTTWLGLQLLTNEAMVAADTKGMEAAARAALDEQIDILKSMGTACKTAVDILDDMIQFDKLESGLLTLRTAPISVSDFLAQTMQSFVPEAKHHQVELLASLDVLSSALQCLPKKAVASVCPEDTPAVGITSGDEMEVDKQKLDSALSTLISSVLKVTPAGGKVVVAAWFVPDPHVEPVSLERRGAIKATRQVAVTPVEPLDSDPVVAGERRPKKSSLFGSFARQFSNSSARLPSSHYASRKEKDTVDRSSRQAIEPDGRLVVVITDVVDGIAHVHHRKEQEIEHFNPRKLVAGGGDGMSLWIARCIVDLHGGTLRYFQEPTGHHHAGAAQGNNFAAAQQKKTFILELPMSRVASSKVDEAPVAPMTLDRSLTGQALLRDPGQSEDGIKASAPPAPSPPRKPSHVAARAGPPGRKASVVNVVPGSRRQSVQEMPDVIGLRRSSVALFAETPMVALPRPQSLNAVPELSMKEIEPAPTASQKMPAAPRGEETIVDEKPLLLVVDDSEMTRKMLCRIVKVHGYDYDEAEDGAVAVAKVESNLASMVGRKYVGILMDFVMPVMDGPTATKAIRALGYRNPVLGVTGNGQDFDVATFLASGANKVFTKPLDVKGFKAFMAAFEAENDNAVGGGP